VCTENRMKTQDPLNCNARLGGSGVDNNSHWSEAQVCWNSGFSSGVNEEYYLVGNDAVFYRTTHRYMQDDSPYETMIFVFHIPIIWKPRGYEYEISSFYGHRMERNIVRR
jgi:hypothetical protein